MRKTYEEIYRKMEGGFMAGIGIRLNKIFQTAYIDSYALRIGYSMLATVTP